MALVMRQVAGPDGTEDNVDVVFGEYEQVRSALAFITGGYVADMAITAQTVTVTPRANADTPGDNDALRVVDTAVDLSGETVTVIADCE